MNIRVETPLGIETTAETRTALSCRNISVLLAALVAGGVLVAKIVGFYNSVVTHKTAVILGSTLFLVFLLIRCIRGISQARMRALEAQSGDDAEHNRFLEVAEVVEPTPPTETLTVWERVRRLETEVYGWIWYRFHFFQARYFSKDLRSENRTNIGSSYDHEAWL